MAKFIEVNIGDVFYRWTVIGDSFKKNGVYYNRCRCSCGTEKDVQKRLLTSPTSPSKSCGCLQREVASEIKTKIPIGSKFSKLTILEDLGINGGRRWVKCSCDCGEVTNSRWDLVQDGNTRSCGCLQTQSVVMVNTTHGKSKSREHSIWTGMKQRCSNPNDKAYKLYGGRGISYDPRWETFEVFYEDMGDCPEVFSLDRIDTDGNYTKENCRWADATTQIHNQRKVSTMKGKTPTSKYIGVSFESGRGKWVARLYKHGKKLLFKRFDTEEEAAKAYDEASEKHYGTRPNEDFGYLII